MPGLFADVVPRWRAYPLKARGEAGRQGRWAAVSTRDPQMKWDEGESEGRKSGLDTFTEYAGDVTQGRLARNQLDVAGIRPASIDHPKCRSAVSCYTYVDNASFDMMEMWMVPSVYACNCSDAFHVGRRAVSQSCLRPTRPGLPNSNAYPTFRLCERNKHPKILTKHPVAAATILRHNYSSHKHHWRILLTVH